MFNFVVNLRGFPGDLAGSAMLEILVVDNTSDAALAFLDRLDLLEEMHITFISVATQAAKKVRTKTYDLILLGNRVSGGDTYDVGLEIKHSKKNWGKPIVCLEAPRDRAIKVANLLKPYSFLVEQETWENLIVKIKGHLKDEVFYS